MIAFLRGIINERPLMFNKYKCPWCPTSQFSMEWAVSLLIYSLWIHTLRSKYEKKNRWKMYPNEFYTQILIEVKRAGSGRFVLIMNRSNLVYKRIRYCSRFEHWNTGDVIKWSESNIPAVLSICSIRIQIKQKVNQLWD